MNESYLTKNNYERALFGLCSAVDNFKWVSTQIFFPESKRKHVLSEHADNLRLAAEKFVKEAKS